MKRKLLSVIICISLASCTQTSQVAIIPTTPTALADKPVASATQQATSTTHPTEIVPTTTPHPFEPKYTFELVDEIGRGIIKNMAVSPDGKVLAVASSIGVWIYRLSDGELLQSQLGDPTITIPHSDIADIVWSPDGKYLAITQDKNGIWIWDTITWNLVSEVIGDKPREEVYGTPGFTWSPDGSQLALGRGFGDIWIWTAASNEWEILENKIDDPDDPRDQYGQLGVLWKNDNQLLTVMDFEFFDVYTGKVVGPCDHWVDGPGRLTWSPNQDYLFFLFDMGGGIIDTETGENIFSCCQQHAWNKDGYTFAGTYRHFFQEPIYVFDAKKQVIIQEYPQINEVFALAWTPQNHLLAALNDDGKTILKDITTNTQQMDLSQHEMFILSKMGDTPTAMSKYTLFTYRDISTGSIVEQNEYPYYWEDQSIYSMTDNNLADSTVDSMGILHITLDDYHKSEFDLLFNYELDGAPMANQALYEASPIRFVSLISGKKELVAGNSSGEIFIWDIESGEMIGYIDSQTSVIRSIYKVENMLYSNSTDGTIKVWKIYPAEK